MTKIDDLRSAIRNGKCRKAEELITELAEEYDLPQATFALFDNYDAEKSLIELAQGSEAKNPKLNTGIKKAVTEAIINVIGKRVTANDIGFYTLAIKRGQIDIVQTFLAANVVNPLLDGKDSPLKVAVVHGKVAIVSLIIAKLNKLFEANYPQTFSDSLKSGISRSDSLNDESLEKEGVTACIRLVVDELKKHASILTESDLNDLRTPIAIPASSATERQLQ